MCVLRILIIFLTTLFVISAQPAAWRSDTVWIDTDLPEWNASLLREHFLRVSYTGGLVFLRVVPKDNPESNAWVFVLNPDGDSPRLKKVEFSGLPQRMYDTYTGERSYRMERVDIYKDRNRMVWQSYKHLMLTDTNYHYVQDYDEPEWKEGKNRYWGRFFSAATPWGFYRNIHSEPIRTDFEKEGVQMSRFSGSSAPKLPPNRFAGLGLINLDSLLHGYRETLQAEKIITFEVCEPEFVRDIPHEEGRLLYPDTLAGSLWMTDDFSRNIIRYDPLSEQQSCLPLVKDLSPVFSDPKYTLQGPNYFKELNWKKDQAKLNTRILNQGKWIANWYDHYLLVSEKENWMCREYTLGGRRDVIEANLSQWQLRELEAIPPSSLMILAMIEYRDLKEGKVLYWYPFVQESLPHLISATSHDFRVIQEVKHSDDKRLAVIRFTRVE